MIPPDLVRRGYEAEVGRHRENLRRALDAVTRTAAAMSNQLGGGEEELADAARRMVADAVDAAQAAAALSAARQLDFAFNEQNRPRRRPDALQ